MESTDDLQIFDGSELCPDKIQAKRSDKIAEITANIESREVGKVLIPVVHEEGLEICFCLQVALTAKFESR
jgi:hypothetical protein